MTNLFFVFVIGLCGFLLSVFLHLEKSKKKPIICPLKGKCDEVVRSRYGHFLGISNTFLGMLFYFGLIVLWLVFVSSSGEGQGIVWLLIAIFASLSFLFSLYLLAIQSFILKKFCTWCVLSSLLVITLFILVLLNAPSESIFILGEYKNLIILVHGLSGAVGVGTTTITDIMFFRFLKDFKISHFENETLKILSEVLWVAIGVLVLSGIALYLPETQRLGESSKFLLKVVIVGVIVLNGLILNFIVTPLLPKMRFDGKDDHKLKQRMKIRRLAFFCGGVSMISWYATFILGSIRSIPVNFKIGLFIYFGILFLVLIGSQLFHARFKLQAQKYSQK